MQQDWTMYVYKADARKKDGQRLVSTTVWRNRTEDDMRRESAELFDTYPTKQGFRIECVPTMKTVKNLMTGQMVQIAHDTPRCCDPSSELYWTM